jgi:hypothetical protein
MKDPRAASVVKSATALERMFMAEERDDIGRTATLLFNAMLIETAAPLFEIYLIDLSCTSPSQISRLTVRFQRRMFDHLSTHLSDRPVGRIARWLRRESQGRRWLNRLAC